MCCRYFRSITDECTNPEWSNWKRDYHGSRLVLLLFSSLGLNYNIIVFVRGKIMLENSSVLCWEHNNVAHQRFPTCGLLGFSKGVHKYDFCKLIYIYLHCNFPMFIFVVMLDMVLNSFTTATEYITFGHYVLPKLTLQCHRGLHSNY
jgi:hypothetical protein